MNMTPSLALQRFREDKPVLIFLNTPVYHDWFVGMAALNGYHALWIDHQHQNYSDDQIAHLCLACRAGGMDAVIRVRKRDQGSYSKALEWGGNGVMVPHVNTPEEARAIVRELKFPPDGNRGIDAVEPPAKFGYIPPDVYVREANRETFIVVQIEEPEAVENVEAIVAVKGIDVLMVGPADLSLRYGCVGKINDPKVQAAIQRVAAAAKKFGKQWGLPVGNAEAAKKYMDMGARFICHGSTYTFVRNGLDQVKKDFGALFGLDEPHPAGFERGY